MARERDLEPAAERGAVHGGDHGFQGALDQVEHLVEAGLPRRLAELGDVGAGDEGAPGAGDDDGADRRVSDRLGDAVTQPLAHVLAQCVDGRVVDGEHGDAAAAIEIDGRGDGCHVAPLSARFAAQSYLQSGHPGPLDSEPAGS